MSKHRTNERSPAKGNQPSAASQGATTAAAGDDKLEVQTSELPETGEQFQGDIIFSAVDGKESEVSVNQIEAPARVDTAVNTNLCRDARVHADLIEAQIKEMTRQGIQFMSEEKVNKFLSNIMRSIMAGVLAEDSVAIKDFCIAMRDLYRKYPDVLHDGYLLQHLLKETRLPQIYKERYQAIINAFNVAFHSEGKVQMDKALLGKLFDSETIANTFIQRLNTMQR